MQRALFVYTNEREGGGLGKFIRYLLQLKITVYAASAGYFIVLSVFPMLVLLLGLLRHTGLEVQVLTQLLEGVIPQALLPAGKRLIFGTYQNSTGAVLSVSAVTALWSASRGIYGLLTGLNVMYGVEENRGYLRTRLLSVGYTFAFLLVLLLTLVLHVSGTTLASMPYGATPFFTVLRKLLELRFFVLLLLQTLLFAAIYKVLPNRKNSFAGCLPGALLAAIGWQVFTNLFSVYVRYFPSYANVFGSVYAVALSMLWLYCCMSIVFCGGALNRYLTETTA